MEESIGHPGTYLNLDVFPFGNFKLYRGRPVFVLAPDWSPGTADPLSDRCPIDN